MSSPDSTEAKILDALMRCGSHTRPAEFLRLLAELAPDDGALLWRIVALEWTGFDRIPHRLFTAAMAKHRTAWTPDVMSPADRAAYDALPTAVTAYRGQSALFATGVAWTLESRVAEGFAAGHRGIQPRAPIVYSARIPKRAIALVCSEREEAEIVLFRPPAGPSCRTMVKDAGTRLRKDHG